MISLFLFHSSLFPPLRCAGWLLSLCSPAGCLRQAISAALRFAVLGSAFDIFPVRHLAPQGMAGFVLANGSMSSNQSGEGDIRRALIEADLVDCMVALPGQLFMATDKFKVALAA